MLGDPLDLEAAAFDGFDSSPDAPMLESHAPTLAAARARIAAVEPEAYARTRNALNGAVTGLSPYLTHGFVTLSDVLAGVCAHHALDIQHKLVFDRSSMTRWRGCRGCCVRRARWRWSAMAAMPR